MLSLLLWLLLYLHPQGLSSKDHQSVYFRASSVGIFSFSLFLLFVVSCRFFPRKFSGLRRVSPSQDDPPFSIHPEEIQHPLWPSELFTHHITSWHSDSTHLHSDNMAGDNWNKLTMILSKQMLIIVVHKIK